MTREQALKETISLWTKMANIAATDGIQVPKGHFEEVYDYKHCCPCCEYTIRSSDGDVNCSRCPMLEEWQAISGAHEDNTWYACEGSRNTPWTKWLDFYSSRKTSLVLCIDVEFFCLLLVDLAQEALDRIADEKVII